MIFYKINETAAGGSTGAGSIAAAPSRFGDVQRRDIKHGESEWRSGVGKDRAERIKSAHVKAQIEKAKKLKDSKKSRFGHFVSRILSKKKVSESFMDIAGITSQLKGLENKNNYDARNTVTYGVEDDEGNLMKVTVKSEDAKSFENRLAMELGEMEDNKIYGFQNSGVSLAEVLYNLRDEFNIVDVEFPEIPSDVIYNADKAALGEQTPVQPQNQDMGGQGMEDDEFGDAPPEAGMGGDEFGGEAGAPPMGGEGGDEFGGAEGGNPDEDMDMEGVEDFSEEEGGESDFKSLFSELVQLMTAQAEKEKAIADAEAEKARALQAEFTAKAANHEMSRQEEMIRMEAELDQQKKREKEAKRYADLAKFRVNKDRGSAPMNFEGYTSFLKPINEFAPAEIDDDLDSVDAINKQMKIVKQKYAPMPGDSPAMQQYKQKAMIFAMNQLNDKMKQARAKQLLTQQQSTQAQQDARQQTQQAQQSQQQAANMGPNQGTGRG